MEFEVKSNNRFFYLFVYVNWAKRRQFESNIPAVLYVHNFVFVFALLVVKNEILSEPFAIAIRF